MSDIKVYGFSFSPFVRKVAVVLEEKGLDYELIPVSPRDWPAELRPHTPLSKIPLVSIDGHWLNDSSVICWYLERTRPTPAMYPTEPFPQAQAMWFEEYIDGGAIPRVGPKTVLERVVKPKFLGQPCDEKAVQEAIANDLPPILSYLNEQIGSKRFLVGDAFTVADITVTGFFINQQHAEIPIDAAKYPNVKRYFDEHVKRPSIAKFVEAEQQFLAGIGAGA